MDAISLPDVAREHLATARAASSGRSALTVHGGSEHVLRQTVITLSGGRELAEHEAHGESTVQVLVGRVRLTAGESSWEGRSGDLLVVPAEPHALHALEDSAVLLTVAMLSPAIAAEQV
ncbi:cupin domain-containing protein [soil metagenome]